MKRDPLIKLFFQGNFWRKILFWSIIEVKADLTCWISDAKVLLKKDQLKKSHHGCLWNDFSNHMIFGSLNYLLKHFHAGFRVFADLFDQLCIFGPNLLILGYLFLIDLDKHIFLLINGHRCLTTAYIWYRSQRSFDWSVLAILELRNLGQMRNVPVMTIVVIYTKGEGRGEEESPSVFH